MRSASRAVALVAAGGMLFVAACTEDSTTPVEVEQERPWSIDQTAPLSSFASTARASRTDPRLLRALARVRPPRGPRRLGVCFYYVRVGGAYEAHKVRIPVATEATRGRSGIRGRQTYRYWRLSPEGEVRRLAVCTIPRTDEAIEATWDYFRVGGNPRTAAAEPTALEGIVEGLAAVGSFFGPAPLHAAQECGGYDNPDGHNPDDPNDPADSHCPVDGIDVDVDRCDNPYHDYLGDDDGCGCANGFLTLDCTDPSPWDDDDEGDDPPDIGGGGGGGGGTGTGDPGPDPDEDCDPELDNCDPCDPNDEICEPDCELDPLAEGCEPDCDLDPFAEGCEPQPCEGNPIEHPRIAPQTISGVDGGRYGMTRTQGTQMHWGLDLQNSAGDDVYSMYDGSVLATGFNEGGWGNWVMVRSTVDGRTVDILYAHTDSGVTSGEAVEAGSVIGSADDSGNLGPGIAQGLAVQHLHVEVREVAGGLTWNARGDFSIDPEEILTTKFESDGDPVPGTSC